MSTFQEIFVSIITLINALSLCLTMNFHLELRSRLKHLDSTLKTDTEDIRD
jgi:hypothetical protein